MQCFPVGDHEICHASFVFSVYIRVSSLSHTPITIFDGNSAEYATTFQTSDWLYFVNPCDKKKYLRLSTFLRDFWQLPTANENIL